MYSTYEIPNWVEPIAIVTNIYKIGREASLEENRPSFMKNARFPFLCVKEAGQEHKNNRKKRFHI